MSATRKSSRRVSQVNYLNLLGDESDTDDFFDGGQESLKHTKKRKTCSSDEEYVDASPPTLPVILKKKTPSSPKRKSSDLGTPESLDVCNLKTQPLTCKPLLGAKALEVSLPTEVINENPGDLRPRSDTADPKSIWPKIATQTKKTRASIHVTPSSCLRIGLSRKNVAKPLHTNPKLYK